MRPLFIVGAGGLGREVLSYVRDIEGRGGVDWRFFGFLDDREEPFGGRAVDAKRVGPVSGHVPEPDAVYVCAIGDGTTRVRIARQLESRGASFINLVHPTAVIRERVTLGTGVLIAPFVRINPDCEIGDQVILNSSAALAHDVRIGEGTTLLGGNSINGNCTIGANVLLGANCVIVPGRRIEDAAQVAAGAVVFRHVRAGQTVIGNPARTI